jgi:hypothetical protein
VLGFVTQSLSVSKCIFVWRNMMPYFVKPKKGKPEFSDKEKARRSKAMSERQKARWAKDREGMINISKKGGRPRGSKTKKT